MTRKLWLYLVPAILLAGLFVWVTMDRDTRRIHKRLNQLAEVVEKERGDGHLQTLAKSQQVVSFFTPEAELRLRPVLSHQATRRELSAIFYQVHSRVESLQFDIRDWSLNVNRQNGTAEMRFTALGTASMGRQNETQVHEFLAQWVKQDREWYIDQVEIVQGIRPPRGE